GSASLTGSLCATHDPAGAAGDMPADGLLLCSRSLFAWPGSAAAPASSCPAGGSAGDPDVFRLGALLALGDVELDLLPFLQAAVAAGDRAEVLEHVRAVLDRDEAVAFVAVEPFHSALRHLDLLVVHAAPRHGLRAALA